MPPHRRPFVCPIPIRFGDIDQAGIAYYPTLFDMTHVAFEEFWEHAIGVSYPRVLLRDHLGFPAVHIEADFGGMLRFGDVLRMEITVLRLGRSSATFRYRARVGRASRPVFEVRTTTACIDMRSMKSRPIPPKYRALLEQQSAAPDADPARAVGARAAARRSRVEPSPGRRKPRRG